MVVRFPSVTRRLARGLPAVLALSAVACTTARRPPAADASRSAAEPVPAADGPAIAPLATFDSVWHVVHRTHWDTSFNGVDWRALGDSLRPHAAAATTQEALRAVLTALVGALGQSHFAILPADDGPAEAEAVAAPGPTGLGIPPLGTPGLTTRWLEGAYVVTHVRDGSPAAVAGVRPGDQLLAVDGVPLPAPDRAATAGSAADERLLVLDAYRIVERRLAGPVGTSLRLRLAPTGGTPREVAVGRDVPEGVATRLGALPTQYAALAWERHLVQGRPVGVIRFNVWMPVLARAFDDALDSLRTADALVLDLRGNPGGVAGMAMGIAGHLVDSAVPVGVMTMRDRTLRFTINPRRVNTAAQRVVPFAGPVALVVDALSASTTEIFAGGLRDLGRVRVFGERTAGQALPAVASRLPNGDVLYHAIADARTPLGHALEGAGVTPDEVVRPTRAALAAGADPALDRAIAWAVSDRAPHAPRASRQ